VHERWPPLTDLAVRYRDTFAYVDGHFTHDTKLPLR
jgi:hypothetical protein